MRGEVKINTTPGLLRVLGLIFLLLGITVLGLTVYGMMTGRARTASEACYLLGLGLVFAFVGWAVFADDYIVAKTWSRDVVFYKHQLFRAVESGQTQLTDQSRLTIEPDPNNERCYRLMLDQHVVRERMSQRQIERLKARLTIELGLATS